MKSNKILKSFNEFNEKLNITGANDSILDLIIFNGHQYYITNDKIEKGDLYINYSNYNRGINDENLKYIIGTVMEIEYSGSDVIIYAEEMKSDLLSSCKKLVLKK